MKIYSRLALCLSLALCLNLPASAGQFSSLIAAAAKATHPNPSPTPAPSGVCDNCNGTGKLGDGTITVPCPVCGGDGKLDAGSTSPAPVAGSGSDSFNAEAAQPDTARAPAAGLSADQQPTPMSAVGEGLRLLNLKPTDTLADIGCGFDCRWGITAARMYGCKVIAIEKDPATADSARRYVAYAGLSHLVEVVTGDATLIDVKANKAAAYLWEDVLKKLPVTKYEAFVSFAHPIAGGRKVGDLYVYQKPKPAEVMQAFRQVIPQKPVAVYGGRTYTRPVCSSGNCSMCNAIRRQLGWR